MLVSDQPQCVSTRLVIEVADANLQSKVPDLTIIRAHGFVKGLART